MLATIDTQNTVLAQLSDLAREYAENARADSTVRAYESDLKSFCAWAKEQGRTCLPASAETVSLWLAWASSIYRPASIERKLAAITVAHTSAGYESPTSHAVVKAVLKGIRRAKGVAQTCKSALSVDDLRMMLARVNTARLIGLRDYALLLVGFASALRRSELVGLDVADVRFEPEGIVLAIRKSKTDQEGTGQEVAVLYGSDPKSCPVRALRAWLDASGIDGPLFRGFDRHDNVRTGRLTQRIVASIVKKYAQLAGLNSSEYAGHSLRSGFATSAARSGKSEASIMRQTRHRSIQVVRKYIRAGTRWDDHAAVGLL
jgi:site-specific recombinase XerD